jgi:type I restriction enzyme R subunit
LSNFAFIPSIWQTFADTAQEAEENALRAPMYTAMLCRKSLEEWVRWLYANDKDLTLPTDDLLSTLIHEPCFKQLVAPIQFDHINLIRKLGNNAVHKPVKINAQESVHAVKLLHGFIGWVVQLYYAEKIQVPPFDETLIPAPPKKLQDKTKDELQLLEKRYHEQQQQLEQMREMLDTYAAQKAQNQAFLPPPSDPNEALTRKLYIDILLQEAGWDPYAPNVAEFEVNNCMPTESDYSGKGFIDYVLWGDDGNPLALVEAKRTTRDPSVGSHQAKLYADCLEKQFGVRPVIYYSNGFTTWMWDDLQYAPRRVHGFYSRDELQMLVNRRNQRKPLFQQPINNDLVDRTYQHLAIRAVCEVLERNEREALLVMATGTGKTRVAAALIDLLSKAGWIKRVLFLADRNALVTQAKNNFNNYLPHLPAIDLTKEKEDESSRIVFSTYQTLINKIDGETDENNRYYGIGHFDLIIFDEIHRSVYNKYKAIFNYFDGYRVGLTATPKSEADRDTYELFGLQPSNPTYPYELEQAIKDGYLVPPRAITVPIKFHRKGIKYAELSEAEKLKYEEEFADPITGQFPSEIDAGALNKWLFNIDTTDKILAYLMEHGIKVSGGDMLGKTIIFARSHNHAVFIRDRFNAQYPEYKGEFLKIIDNQEEYRYDLLNKFKEPDKFPQIAVSVDMLDTGIDVPEIVNLVFYKPVRSSAKYWQMIGRGTRLCNDLFGPGMHKKEFVIFDLCENFEFFGQNPDGFEATKVKSISQRLFELRVRLAVVLRNTDNPDLKEYANLLFNHVINQVQALDEQKFMVRQHWEHVVKYKDAARWNSLSDLDIKELFDHIGQLIIEVNEDESAKRFDALLYDLQITDLHGSSKKQTLSIKVMEIARKLTNKLSIPHVKLHEQTIRQAASADFWNNTNTLAIERIRTDLRELIKYLDKDSGYLVFTNFTDDFEGATQDVNIVYQELNLEAYKKRVLDYINSVQNNLVIIKLRNNISITPDDMQELEKLLFDQSQLGTRAAFVNAFGEQPLGRFIRSIVGLDAKAAEAAFAKFLENKNLNSRQIRFIKTLINYLTQNGTIEPSVLYEAPFTEINDSGISGLFDDQTADLIFETIEVINRNAAI